MYIYCLFCKETRCKDLTKILEKRLDCRAIVPLREYIMFKDGQRHKVLKPLFPGYILVYSETPLEIKSFYLDGVIGVLNAEEKDPSLRGRDYDFAMMVLNKKGVIRKIKIIENGTALAIADDEFRGVDVEVVKLDRRRNLAVIAMQFGGSPMKMWIECEIEDKE